MYHYDPTQAQRLKIERELAAAQKIAALQSMVFPKWTTEDLDKAQKDRTLHITFLGLSDRMNVNRPS